MIRKSVKFILKTAGLLPAARRLVKFLSRYPRHLADKRQFREFKRQYAHVLGEHLNNPTCRQKVALVVSPFFPEVVTELGLIKGLELANFVPVILVPRSARGRLVARYYALAGIKAIRRWDEFVDRPDFTAAKDVIDQCQSTDDLLGFDYAGVRVGRLAVSTALRRQKSGFLDLQSPEARQFLVERVAEGMAYAKAAQRMVQEFHPELVLFVDTVYTPMGELYDYCLKNRIDTIQWQAAHKSNALILKRYTLETRDEHPRSLSPKMWQFVRDMPWTEAHREQLHLELYNNYVSGDWYSVVSTQFNKRLVEGSHLREQLGLDPARRTAFIFPHILWDATLFWGKCLFHDFEEWLIETVRAACANDQVNWVIKIHPANRRVRDGFRGEPAEAAVLRKHIGNLPSHVHIIPAESDISTFSLFDIMDYCVTVYGTIGMEAARLGIPVLTGGWGIYDHKGFTIDSESRAQYLERLTHIQNIPRLTPVQRELAERFAYGVFFLRPFFLKSVSLDYESNVKKFATKAQINIKTSDEWYTASDLNAFARWVTTSGEEDFVTLFAEHEAGFRLA